MSPSAWIIEDWTGKRCYPDMTFPSFEEARSYISERANEEAKSEDEYDGICEDLYAVEVQSVQCRECGEARGFNSLAGVCAPCIDHATEVGDLRTREQIASDVARGVAS